MSRLLFILLFALCAYAAKLSPPDKQNLNVTCSGTTFNMKNFNHLIAGSGRGIQLNLFDQFQKSQCSETEISEEFGL